MIPTPMTLAARRKGPAPLSGEVAEYFTEALGMTDCPHCPHVTEEHEMLIDRVYDILVSLYCKTCAKEADTHQVVCWIRPGYAPNEE